MENIYTVYAELLFDCMHTLALIIIRLQGTDITLSAYNIHNDNYKYGDTQLNREANELDARRSLAK